MQRYEIVPGDIAVVWHVAVASGPKPGEIVATCTDEGAAEMVRDVLNADASRTLFDFRAHLIRQIRFSEQTFGPEKRFRGILDHIRKEIAEIEAAGGEDVEEWIDIMILAIDGAWRALRTKAEGAEKAAEAADVIIKTLVGKQTKNEARTWPDWRTISPDKAIEHDRSDEGGLSQNPMRRGARNGEGNAGRKSDP